MVEIVRAGIADAAAILELQKLAYRSEAEIYGDVSIPPLAQTLGELEAEFGQKTVLKAESDGILVGSVRGFEADGTAHVVRLMVRPAHQGRGIGTRLMAEFEAAFPKAGRFELFTGRRSERNLRLYARLGYRVFRYEMIRSGLELVFLEKARNAP